MHGDPWLKFDELMQKANGLFKDAEAVSDEFAKKYSSKEFKFIRLGGAASIKTTKPLTLKFTFWQRLKILVGYRPKIELEFCNTKNDPNGVVNKIKHQIKF